MVAGHETTSVALAWTLYELAKNPLIQLKVRAEINTVLCEGNELTWDTVEELKYLENVIKESLRLHPPAYLTIRTPISDEIVGGYLIPKGVDILLPIDSLQRGTQHWQNPDEFYPERFNEKGIIVFVSSQSLLFPRVHLFLQQKSNRKKKTYQKRNRTYRLMIFVGLITKLAN